MFKSLGGCVERLIGARAKRAVDFRMTTRGTQLPDLNGAEDAVTRRGHGDEPYGTRGRDCICKGDGIDLGKNMKGHSRAGARHIEARE